MTDGMQQVPTWTPGTGEPFEEYDRLRGQCPVAFSDSYGGFWSLLTHAEVSRAARDWKTFSSGKGSPFVEFPDFARSIPINLDPPEHGGIRKLLSRYLVPGRIAQLEPRIRAFVTEHMDELLDGGRGDGLVVARPLPQRALAAALNMPDDAYLMFVAKMTKIAEAGDDAKAANELLRNLWTDEVVELVESRRARPLDPDTDLMTGVITAEIDGKPIPDADCVAIGIQLFAAGGETTTSGIMNSLYYVATQPEVQRRLRAEPGLIPAAVEEFLRMRPPLHHLARTTTGEATVGACPIPAGSRVALNYAAANRDARVFPEPDSCDIDRTPNRHLTFGFGPHTCLGAPLARLEIKLVLEAVLGRTTWIELDGDPVELIKVNLASGFSSLPLTFTA